MGYVKWLGHSAFEIFLNNNKILIDPWLTNPFSPVKPDEYTDIDLIIVTHDHGDHLGETLDILKRIKKAKFVGIYELACWIAEQGIEENRTIGGNIGGPIQVNDLKIVLTPAEHSATRGFPVGVILLGKEAVLYHAGDTGLGGFMPLLGDLYKIDIAMIPIGSHFTMDPYQATKAVELIKPRIVIPMHYKTFPVTTGDPEEFAKLVNEKAPSTKVVILKPGEKLNF